VYWSDPDRHPFLIRMDGKLAGLILVKKGPRSAGGEAVWDMAEFFVVRAWRRRGIGTLAAHEIWKRFPGPWEVRVMQANVLAAQFWAVTVALFTGQAVQSAHIDSGGKSWIVFSFESNGSRMPGA
jgi:predicted acetyltransferase